MIQKSLNNQEKLDAWDSKQGLGDRVLDSDRPLWWKMLNLQASEYEWSKYLGKFRLKTLGILRKLAPGLYTSIAEDIKDQNEALDMYGNKMILGKKIGSIPLTDFFSNPELQSDPKAQDKYFKEHPEFRNTR